MCVLKKQCKGTKKREKGKVKSEKFAAAEKGKVKNYS